MGLPHRWNISRFDEQNVYTKRTFTGTFAQRIRWQIIQNCLCTVQCAHDREQFFLCFATGFCVGCANIFRFVLFCFGCCFHFCSLILSTPLKLNETRIFLDSYEQPKFHERATNIIPLRHGIKHLRAKLYLYA